MNAFWYHTTNVGDALSPVVLAYASQRPISRCEADTANKVIGVGSILRHACAGDILFGTGSFEADTIPGSVTPVLLRGPLTAKRAGLTPDWYGDGALLMPKIYPACQDKTTDFGVFPHYVDAARLPKLPDGALVINARFPYPDVIAAILQCRVVLSSSLHGIVLAEAYGVPAIHVDIAGSASRIISFEWKHNDYYLGTNREPRQAIPLLKAFDGSLAAPPIPHTVFDCLEFAVGSFQAALASRNM